MRRISVIIPAHNEAQYITKTLQSISESSIKPLEVIVVCDTCTDKTAQISKTRADIYHVKYKSISKTRNYGAKKAKGDILAFIDADTIIDEHYLANILGAVSNGATYGAARYRSETRTFLGGSMALAINVFNRLWRTMGGISFVTKEAFVKSGGFDEQLRAGEDTEFGDRLRKQGEQFRYLKESFVIPSERRFKRHGYIRTATGYLIGTAYYLTNKQAYRKRHGA